MVTDLAKKNYTNIEFHNTTSWDSFRSRPSNLQIRVDELNIPKLCYIQQMPQYPKCNFYTYGKYFIFILLNDRLGLKILHNKIDIHTENREKESLEKVIKIQKLLYKENITFNCSDKPIDIRIKYKSLNESKLSYCYLTETDINRKKIEHSYFKKMVLQQYPYLSDIIYNQLNIRRGRLRYELRKVANFILTPKNELKLIDIDPKFYI